MSDSHIQVGDEVSWNWGGGRPTGQVAEIKTSGKLEIESKGKRVHKNADEHDPAVHVERSGNDVVKRASELSRLRGGGEGAAEETVAQGGGEGEAAGESAVQGAKEATGEVVQEGGESGGTATAPADAEIQATGEGEEETKRGSKRGGKARGKRATAETRKKQSEAGKKGAAARKAKASERGRGKATAEEAVVGEKREREEGKDIEERATMSEQEVAAEEAAGKGTKKAKVDLQGEEPAPELDAELATPQSGKKGGRRGTRGTKVQNVQ